MTRDKQLAIGAIALVLFGGLALKQMKDDSKLGSKAAQEASLPKLESDEGADKITVTNGEKGEFVLEKKGEEWEVVKPLSAKANGQNVKLALANLGELKIREQISSNPDAELLKGYELDAAKGLRVVVEKGGKVVVDAVFGKSGGRGQLMTIAGTQGVFAATGFSNFLFARDTKGWRDVEITKFEDTKAIGLHYALGDRKLDFTLEGTAWSGTENGKALARFDAERVKDALRSLQTLNADDFADGKADADVGLDKPVGSFQVDLKEAASIKLTIGGETPSKGRWVKRQGAGVATALPSYAVDWIMPDTSKFQTAAAAPAK